MAAKRHLPMAPNAVDSESEPKRAPWQWVGLGTLAIFVVWLPLSAAAFAMASRLSVPVGAGVVEPGPAAIALFIGFSALALAVASVVGGFIVGRWGGASAGVREAAFAGLVAPLVAATVSWARFGFGLAALAVVPLAIPFAALGGKLGRLARR